MLIFWGREGDRGNVLFWGVGGGGVGETYTMFFRAVHFSRFSKCAPSGNLCIFCRIIAAKLRW